MPDKMLVDSKVYDLAKFFLDDVKAKQGDQPIGPEDVQELAEAIQQTIEDFIGSIVGDDCSVRG